MSAVLQDFSRVRPRVQRGPVSFEAAISITRERPFKNLAGQIAQFETILTFYKRGVEIPYLLAREKDAERDIQHRTILTSILSLGETLLSDFTTLPAEEKSSVGYDEAFLKSNVRYLRDKYQQWYGTFDRTQADADFEKIQNALSKPPA